MSERNNIKGLPRALVRDLVMRTLDEDLRGGVDITSAATIDAKTRAQATIASRAEGVLAGLDFALAAFAITDPSAKIDCHKSDGDALRAGDAILSIEGGARAIMAAERTAINFIGHLSGIASHTARLYGLIKHTDALLYDTRKTTPLLRAVEKYAVRCGGGRNHRTGLFDGILIKDNHIAVAGGVRAALQAMQTHKKDKKDKKDMKVEIEVDTLAQLDEVIEATRDGAGADIVLLDNMSPDLLREAVAKIKSSGVALVSEASGGINEKSIVAIAESGVDYVSVGRITHSSPSLDVGLDIKLDA